MRVACVLVVAVATIVSASMPMPALANSNGVTVYCGIEGSERVRVSIKALNDNEYPMKCNVVCRMTNGKGERVEVKVTDKAVEGPEETYQTLLEQKMTEGPYSAPEHDYSCTKP